MIIVILVVVQTNGKSQQAEKDTNESAEGHKQSHGDINEKPSASQSKLILLTTDEEVMSPEFSPVKKVNPG